MHRAVFAARDNVVKDQIADRVKFATVFCVSEWERPYYVRNNPLWKALDTSYYPWDALLMATMTVGSSLVSTPVIVGPLLTLPRFKYWYLACSTDGLVAVPQSAWTGTLLGLSNSANPLFGLVGVLIMHLAQKGGESTHDNIVATLRTTPAAQLRSQLNTTYDAAQLRSITFRAAKFGGAISGPVLILESKTGAKQTFAVHIRDFERFRTDLNGLYPELCKSI